ncbi:MAG TPA: hypothetical protein VGP57_22745 [Actinoplanes sp.]|jgi:hypothetical protein|nr:hypothetical protein [Actinoplanes sp.]
MTDQWLVQEVNDLLDASSVGLYELMELLDDPDQQLSAGERREIARRALERILSGGGVALYRKRWPDSDNLGVVSLAELPADPWRGPDQDGQYLALDRF